MEKGTTKAELFFTRDFAGWCKQMRDERMINSQDWSNCLNERNLNEIKNDFCFSKQKERFANDHKIQEKKQF